MFDQMQANGCTPDVVTYTALISALERGGQWQLALDVFNQMVQRSCKPDAIVYNAIIDALWQTGVVWAQVGAAGHACLLASVRRACVKRNSNDGSGNSSCSMVM